MRRGNLDQILNGFHNLHIPQAIAGYEWINLSNIEFNTIQYLAYFKRE